MQFILYLVTLFAVVTSALAFQHDDTAPDGVYAHYVDEDGASRTLLVAPLNSRATNRWSSSKREDDGVQCQSDIQMNGSDAVAAANSLAEVFGNEFTFFKSISAKSGSAVVYGCDYGHGQTMTADKLLQYMTDVATQCGWDSAGYFRVTGSKCAFGRTNVGIGFC